LAFGAPPIPIAPPCSKNILEVVASEIFRFVVLAGRYIDHEAVATDENLSIVLDAAGASISTMLVAPPEYTYKFAVDEGVAPIPIAPP